MPDSSVQLRVVELNDLDKELNAETPINRIFSAIQSVALNIYGIETVADLIQFTFDSPPSVLIRDKNITNETIAEIVYNLKQIGAEYDQLYDVWLEGFISTVEGKSWSLSKNKDIQKGVFIKGDDNNRGVEIVKEVAIDDEMQKAKKFLIEYFKSPRPWDAKKIFEKLGIEVEVDQSEELKDRFYQMVKSSPDDYDEVRRMVGFDPEQITTTVIKTLLEGCEAPDTEWVSVTQNLLDQLIEGPSGSARLKVKLGQKIWVDINGASKTRIMAAKELMKLGISHEDAKDQSRSKASRSIKNINDALMELVNDTSRRLKQLKVGTEEFYTRLKRKMGVPV